jgi:ketosteroid isomerase-like protein
MPQESVEIVRQSMEAIDRRDRTTYLALHDEDFEVINIRDFPEPGVRGPEAVWDFYVEGFDTFDPERTSIADAELVDAGADKVLVHHRYDLRGARSGADVEMDLWSVVTLREGRILRMGWFAGRVEALEAAGLSD